MIRGAGASGAGPRAASTCLLMRSVITSEMDEVSGSAESGSAEGGDAGSGGVEQGKHIFDWTGEQVEAFFRNRCKENEMPFPESYTLRTGQDLCAFSNEERAQFLVDIGFRDKTLALIAAELSQLITAQHVASSSLRIRQNVPPVSDEDRRQTLKKLSEQFVSLYIDKFGLVQRFKEYICNCLATFQKNSFTYLAPYVALVQSSGYGKSRLLRETAKEFVTLYVCFRGISVSGYPRRTVLAEQALFGGLGNIKNRDEYVHKLEKRLGLLCRNAVLLKSQLVDSDQFVEESTNQVVDESDRIINSALFPSERLAHLWELKEVGAEAVVDVQESPMILALDEAKELLDPVYELGVSKFRLLRAALRLFSEKDENKKYKLIAVFVDTHSKIHNFTPNLQDDYSAREGSALDEMEFKNMKLFHPFIIGETFDLFFKEHVHEDLSQLISSTEYLRAGRPLVAQDAGFDFLSRKLLGGTANVTPEVSLGVILSRVAAFVCPRHSLAVDLVAGHMATLLACDKERSGILSTYVAEPRLAIAAAKIWEDEENFFSKHGVVALQSALMSGALSQGIRGEIVGQIVLLLAFDAACKAAGGAFGDCVDLMRVLEQLLPSTSSPDILREVIPDSLKSAKVACCQFVQLAYEFGPKTRILLAERHCGVLFREGQRCADAVIPVLAEEHAFLMIQFKNLSSCQNHCGYSSIACSELLPSKVFATSNFEQDYIKNLDSTSVRLFMQVGADSASSYCASEGRRSNVPKALEIFGLESRCLNTERREALRILVRGNVSLSSYLQECADLKPNPDPIFAYARNSWPFVIERYSDGSEAWSAGEAGSGGSVVRRLGAELAVEGMPVLRRAAAGAAAGGGFGDGRDGRAARRGLDVKVRLFLLIKVKLCAFRFD